MTIREPYMQVTQEKQRVRWKVKAFGFVVTLAVIALFAMWLERTLDPLWLGVILGAIGMLPLTMLATFLAYQVGKRREEARQSANVPVLQTHSPAERSPPVVIVTGGAGYQAHYPESQHAGIPTQRTHQVVEL